MSNQTASQYQIVNYVFDDLNRFLNKFVLNGDNSNDLCESENNESNGFECKRKFSAVLKVDGYFLSVFTNLLKTSGKYSDTIVIKIELVKPKIEVLDYGWNERIGYLLNERLELEHAMSWLSTLGGAFSALGDSIENCAKVAGKISVQQFKIAYRLGEPPLVARCKLYMALSLIQLGKCQVARKIITEQYELAKVLTDIKLQNMCKGVWAKLQYVYHQQKIRHKNKMICDQ